MQIIFSVCVPLTTAIYPTARRPRRVRKQGDRALGHGLPGSRRHQQRLSEWAGLQPRRFYGRNACIVIF